jgi:hypothetical protein
MSSELTGIDEARRVAREYAAEMNYNESRAEAYAEVWFDAGKDADASTTGALRLYLAQRFTTSA